MPCAANAYLYDYEAYENEVLRFFIIHLRVGVSSFSCYIKDTFHRKKLFIITEFILNLI